MKEVKFPRILKRYGSFFHSRYNSEILIAPLILLADAVRLMFQAVMYIEEKRPVISGKFNDKVAAPVAAQQTQS